MHLIHHLRQTCQWSRMWDAKPLAVLPPNPAPNAGAKTSREMHGAPQYRQVHPVVHEWALQVLCQEREAELA